MIARAEGNEPACPGASLEARAWTATGPARGYMLVEMIVAAAVTCAVAGVLLRLAVAAHADVRAADEVSDLHHRLRVAVEAMRQDLLMAGAGPGSGSAPGPLADAFAPIVPARLGMRSPDPELSFQSDRLSLMYVPREAAVTTLVRAAAGGDPLGVDGTAPGCAAGGTCGIRPGDRLVVYNADAGDGGFDILTVASVDGSLGLVVPATALSGAYTPGATVASVVQRTYYLDRPGRRLMVYDGDRSDLPLVDHVADLRVALFGDPSPVSLTSPGALRRNCAYDPGDPPVPRLADLGGASLVPLGPGLLTDGPACGVAPRRFDADLLRVRRIEVSIRLEAEGAEFRGSGAAFANRGTSGAADRYVPDLDVMFDLAPRNMGNTGLR